jgi:hypothetical protein
LLLSEILSLTEQAATYKGGQPEPVRVHDFKIPELGKVAPYSVYDIAANHGWVSVGIETDTEAFNKSTTSGILTKVSV